MLNVLQDQYVFIHDVLLEYIQSGETEVKDFGIVQYIKDLIKRDPTEGSLLEKQYKVSGREKLYRIRLYHIFCKCSVIS